MRARPFAALLALVALCTPSSSARAAPVWIGDLETGDTSQWEGVLNPSYIEIVSAPVAQGAHAAKLTLTNDAVWQNGLKRVELNHSPPPARTAEGAELWVAWSVRLESALPPDITQEIGYWESKNSYRGAMTFEATGQSLLFTTRNPYRMQWQADGVLTPGVWHRIAMHVLWSTDPSKGVVDVWYDGAQVVTHAVTQTLNDDNWHFLQVGLLRENVPFADAPVMLIDDAVEGDSLADVHPALASSSSSSGAGGASASSSAASSSGASEAASSSAASTSSGGSAVTSSGASSSGTGGAPASDDGGMHGGCATAPSSPDLRGVVAFAAVFALALGALRRTQRARSLPAPKAHELPQNEG